MNILSISGILPVPGLITSNDFVLHTLDHYKDQFVNDKVVIFRSTQYKTNLKKIFSSNTEFDRLKKDRTLNIHNFRVEILPFYSSRRFRNLHSIVTYSIYLLNQKRIIALMEENNFDIIHAQYIFPDGLLACILHKKFRIPYVITTHTELFYLKHFLSRKIAYRILQNASFVLPINMRNYLFFKGIGLDNVEVVPLGFNKSFLRVQKLQTSDRIKIVTIAELIPLKNIDKVILAIEKLVPANNISYTVIGKGPEKKRLSSIVTDHGLDSYVNFIDGIPHEKIANELYGYDIFIMPSFPETFGRVYVEAMAMGIPIICAKNSGIHGYFKEGEEGIAVDHQNIEEIAQSLKFLISNHDKRMQIGKQGQKLVEKYTWDQIASTLHDKYLMAVHKTDSNNKKDNDN